MFLYVTDLTMMTNGDKFNPRSDHARLRKTAKSPGATSQSLQAC